MTPVPEPPVELWPILAELERQLRHVVEKGRLDAGLQWNAAITVEGRDPYIALLSVAPVTETR